MSRRPRRAWASAAPDSSERRPDGQAQRAPEQLGVGELLARSALAVVVNTFEAGAGQLRYSVSAAARSGVPALPSATSSTSHGAIDRGQRSPLVGVLLDGRGRDPRRPDPVGAHDDELLGAALVEVGAPSGSL